MDFNKFKFKINLIDGQINLGLNLDLDIEAHKKTQAHDRQKVYKRKVAKRFEYIIFGIYMLQLDLVQYFLFLVKYSYSIFPTNGKNIFVCFKLFP